MLKKSDFPYFNKGRWYQIRIHSSGKKSGIIESQIDAVIKTDVVFLPEEFHILDMKMDVTFKKKNSDAFAPAITGNEKTQGFLIPGPESYEDIVAWVYGYTPGKGGD